MNFQGKIESPLEMKEKRKRKKNVFNNMLLPEQKSNPKREKRRQIAGINANLYTIYSLGRLTSFLFSLHLLAFGCKECEIQHSGYEKI